MSRRARPLRLAAVLIGIVAIAVAAATISSTVDTGGPDGGVVGPGEDPAYSPPPPADTSVGAADVPAFLEALVLAVVVLLAIALAWYLIAHRRELVATLAVTFAMLAVLVALFVFLSRVDPGSAANATGMDAVDGGDLPGGGTGEGEIGALPFGSTLVLLVVLVTIFASALVVSRADDRPDADVPDDPPPADDVSAIGPAAGRAAERIEGAADVDNEVYRAWRELTRHLEVERPETSTPGEFATAAVEAGMARRHVEELTRLFEDVRYGHRETTDDLERRAVSTLRRIEASYATDEERGADTESGDDGGWRSSGDGP